MEFSDYITLGSLVISFTAIVLSLITSTKRYELTSAQRSEILTWYRDIVEVLISLKLCIETKVDYNRIEKLSKLSALIECGRFYFPNVDKKDGFGDEKPSAYRGYREITLEFLIYSYNICMRNDANKYIVHLEQLQRLFTSKIFDALSPNKYNKMMSRNTNISLNKRMSLDDFLVTDPNKFDYFSEFM